MKHKSTLLIVTVICLAILSYAAVKHSSAPPTGYTGASGSYCTSCHTGSVINPAGGSVTVTGLPTVSFVPGQVYNFSITTNHATPDRVRWGFAISARNSYGSPIGTFSTTNANAAINGTELGHSSAVSTTARNTYTYANLKWTAPVNPDPLNGDDMVTFYYCSVAGNGSGSGGDYVYKGETSAPVPVILSTFIASVRNANAVLNWQTTQEINSSYFSIERSIDNSHFAPIGRLDAAGNSSAANNYSFTDHNPSCFDKPVYYRLNMVDKNGAKNYSKITTIIIPTHGTYVNNIYPNPATRGNMIHVNLVAQSNDNITLQLIDNGGRINQTINKPVVKGTNILDVVIPATAAGVYTLVVKTSAGSQQIPVLIH
jgi:hypothetical protein